MFSIENRSPKTTLLLSRVLLHVLFKLSGNSLFDLVVLLSSPSCQKCFPCAGGGLPLDYCCFVLIKNYETQLCFADKRNRYLPDMDSSVKAGFLIE